MAQRPIAALVETNVQAAQAEQTSRAPALDTPRKRKSQRVSNCRCILLVLLGFNVLIFVLLMLVIVVDDESIVGSRQRTRRLPRGQLILLCASGFCSCS